MKRLALLFALAVLPIVAQTSNPGFAPWDGVHPGFTVETFGIDFGSLQGAVPYEESKRYSLCFLVLATDPKINNVRVTINYIDANGNPQKSRQDADFPTNGGSWMYLSFPIRISQVVGSPYFEGRTTAGVATFGPAQ